MTKAGDDRYAQATDIPPDQALHVARQSYRLEVYARDENGDRYPDPEVPNAFARVVAYRTRNGYRITDTKVRQHVRR